MNNRKRIIHHSSKVRSRNYKSNIYFRYRDKSPFHVAPTVYKKRRWFTAIQKDRLKEMRKWAGVVKKLGEKASFGIVAANNHYAGFGPATANSFRKMIGMDQVLWEEMKQARLD